MGMIRVSNTTDALMPEGRYTFEITKANYDENTGRMNISMKTINEHKYEVRFTLLEGNGEPNGRALEAFALFASNCLNNFEMDEIEEQNLLGSYIQGDIKHMEGKMNPKADDKYQYAVMDNVKPADFTDFFLTELPTEKDSILKFSMDFDS